MKNYLLYILILVQFYYLNGMKQDQEQDRFSICNQIKQIAPNASRATYRELAENLSKNNLSTCACMAYLMQEREKKAIGLITKSFVSQETGSIIKELYQQHQQRDATDEQNGIPLTIHYSPSIDSDMQANITEKFSEKYRTTTVPTEEFFGDPKFASASRPNTLWRGKNGDGSKFVNFEVGNAKINIPAAFGALPSNVQNAVLKHEKHHLDADHLILQELWDSATGLDHFIANSNDEKYIIDKEQEKNRSKLSRAYEAAADRIPAACNDDCKLASDFIEAMQWRISSDNRGLIGSFIAKMNNYLGKKDKLSQHPSNEKRLQWAQRIYNLKLAEQEIKQNMDEK